jgi:hypothetical protein
VWLKHVLFYVSFDGEKYVLFDLVLGTVQAPFGYQHLMQFLCHHISDQQAFPGDTFIPRWNGSLILLKLKWKKTLEAVTEGQPVKKPKIVIFLNMTVSQ